MRRRPLAAALFAGLLATGAAAQTPPAPPSAEGAARLRAVIEAEWDRLDQLMPSGMAFVRDGGVSVEPAGAAYRVRMPRTRLDLKGDASLDLGVLEAIARPAADDTVDIVSPMPGLIAVRDASGDAVAELRIGGGEARVAYSLRDGRSSATTLEITDVAVAPVADPSKQIGIARIVFDAKGTPVVNGRRDDETRMAIEGIAFADAESDASVSIGRIEARSRSKGLDPVASEALGIALNAFIRSAERGEADPGRLLPLVPRLRDIVDGGDTRFEMSELTVVAPDGTAFALGNLGYGVTFSGLRSGFSRIGLDFSLADLALDGVPLPPEAVPQRLALRLTLDRIPNAAVGDAIQSLLERMAKGEDPSDTAPMLGLGLIGALTQAGTEFRIDEAGIATAEFSVAADGATRLDPNSPMMAVARLGVTLTGMDRFAALLEGSGMIEERDRRSVRAILALVTAVGQPATDARGRSVRRYEFAVDPTGAVTLNGADFQPILESIMSTPFP